MSLEFNKLIDQVQTMSRFLAHKAEANSNRLLLALERFLAADDLDVVHERIRKVRESSVSGYRGAAPAPQPFDEVVCERFPLPELPPEAVILAVDGSQIYPDPHASAPYYLINMGMFAYYHGETRIPDQATQPFLYYNDNNLLDRDGRLINNQTVNARRSVMEMEHLAEAAWNLRDDRRLALAIHDGGLLKFFGATDVAGAQALEGDYMTALGKLRDARAALIGYLERSRSQYIISLLHLLSLPDELVTDANLKTNGELEGLTDDLLFKRVLKPGERSAIMTQNSPQNYAYKTKQGADFEIAFFYLNVASAGDDFPVIIRVDLPMWVAKDKPAVAAIHALIAAQCAIQGRKHYPYALTRADELAHVSGGEKAQLEEMIRVNMRRHQLTAEESNKLQTKGLARADRRQHKLG